MLRKDAQTTRNSRQKRLDEIQMSYGSFLEMTPVAVDFFHLKTHFSTSELKDKTGFHHIAFTCQIH